MIGRLEEDIFNLLIEFIEELNDSGDEFQEIMGNL